MSITIRDAFIVLFVNKSMIFFKKQEEKPQIDETQLFELKKLISTYLEERFNRIASYDHKKIDEMLMKCDTILENEPNNIQACLAKGLLFETKLKPKDALQSYERVLELEPNNLNALGHTALILENKNDKKAVEFVDKTVPLVKSILENLQNSNLKNYFEADEQIKKIYTKPTLLEKHSMGSKLLQSAGTGATSFSGSINASMAYRDGRRGTAEKIRRENQQKIGKMNESYEKELRKIRGSVLVLTNKRLVILGYDGKPVQEIIIDKNFVEKEVNDVLDKKREFESGLKEKTESDSILGKVKGSITRASSMASFTTKKDIEVLVNIEKKKHLLGKEYIEIKTKRPIPDIERGAFGRLGSKTNYINDLDFAEKSFDDLFEFLKPRSEEIDTFLDSIK